MVSNQDIVLEKQHGVTILTLNRPEKMNAITYRMRDELNDIFSSVDRDDETKVLILTGAGERAFCAGADSGALADLAGDSSTQKAEGQTVRESRWLAIRPVGHMALALYNLHKPVIGAVNGVAAGAGLSLALLCDLRIASENARFTLSNIKRGIIPDYGATYYLPRLVGKAKALELMWSGDIIDAKEAERIGLVSKLVSKDRLMSEAKEFAHRLAQGPSVAIELTKWAVQKSLDNDFESQLDFETRAQARCNMTEDFKEGVQSLLEKREPRFQGR